VRTVPLPEFVQVFIVIPSCFNSTAKSAVYPFHNIVWPVQEAVPFPEIFRAYP